MRISKLFHWLYASIMLMPIFAIGVKSLYVTFNPNAKDSYYGETINEEQYVNISFTNFQLNNTYYQTIGNITYDGTAPVTNILVTDFVINGVTRTDVSMISYRVYNNSNRIFIFDNTNTYLDDYRLNEAVYTLQFKYLGYSGSNLASIYDIFTTIQYNDYSYIDNVFYYSVEQISNEGLFNWANGTFLAQPLLFITNLFGVPSTSPIITILCYWFAISVIWLVFDVIMYIPLLVHRWLDKGVIE